jgi:glycerol-3-phosphate dehydrogenase
MAEDAVDRAIETGGLEWAESVTENLPISPPEPGTGSGEMLHPTLPYTTDDVIRAINDEMARTVEDVLARRTRALFLNAKVAVEIAPKIAKTMANELGNGDVWIEAQVSEFMRVAANYLKT